MSLAIRSRLGQYEITGALGAGGMGEVYRAREGELRFLVMELVEGEGLADTPPGLSHLQLLALVLPTDPRGWAQP